MPRAQKPPPLLPGYRRNFDTLLLAADNAALCLVSAIRRADRKPIALVCARQRNEDETFTPVPLAVLCEGNPYVDFEDPTV